MKINRKELLENLTLIMPGIGNKFIEHSEYVFFDKKCIFSNNLEINISLPFETDFVCGVPAIEFYKLLQKMVDDEIEIDDNATTLSIKGKKTKAELVIVDIENSKFIETTDIDEWDKLPNNFIEAVDFCRFSAATDSTLGVLTWLFVKDAMVMSCDNYRASIFTMDNKVKSPMLLSSIVAKELIKYEPIEYAIKDSYIFFRNKSNVVFGCLTINEEYRDIDFIFDVTGNEIVFPNKLKESISRIDILAENEMGKRYMDIIIKENKIICRGGGIMGKIEESHRIKISDNVEFKIQTKLFSQILEKTQQAIIGENSVLFTGDNFKHIVALAMEI